MIQRTAAAGARNGDEVMKSLKQRPDLPSRVRSLLEGLLERSANQFEHAVSRTLDELEQELFKLAERARSNEQQHARFEALREIGAGAPTLRRGSCCTSNPRSRTSILRRAGRPKRTSAPAPR